MTTAAASPGLLPSLRDLASLTKPRVTLLVLLTAGTGLWLAPASLPAATIWLMLLATAAIVGSANALNCWLERDIDRRMQRTRRRPLPAGRMQPHHALLFGLLLGAISIPVLVFAVNPLTGFIGACALVSYVWLYTPMKQRSPKALLVGAIPGALPPLMGWTAATGRLDAPGLALFAILFLWQLPHFIAIAVYRKDEYAAAGLQVLPAVRGNRVARRHAVLYAGALVPVTLLAIPLQMAGTVYLITASALGAGFFLVTLWGVRPASANGASGAAEREMRWARQVFLASLAYLPLLFAALMLDAR